MGLLLLLVAGTAALFVLDAGSYFWLRANEARRTPPVGQLPAILGLPRQKSLRGSR